MAERDDIERVLSFWLALDEKAQFGSDPTFDERIRREFGPLHEAALAGRLDGWADTPRGALALVVLLDQFSRNIHRGTAMMYAGDDKVLALAQRAIAAGFDQAIDPKARIWLYIPFMHSERLDDQERCIALLTAGGYSDNLPWAIDHRDIIQRFGRFPHRNAILGRPTTEAEAAFLRDGGFAG